MIVLVSCGASKASTAQPAARLYQGGHFKCAYAWAQSMHPEHLFILSALHGLVTPDTVIDPYNLKMGQPGSITGDTLRAQAAELSLERTDDTVVVCGGQLYVNAAREVWPHAVAPFSRERGIKGIGYAMAEYMKMMGRLP